MNNNNSTYHPHSSDLRFEVHSLFPLVLMSDGCGIGSSSLPRIVHSRRMDLELQCIISGSRDYFIELVLMSFLSSLLTLYWVDICMDLKRDWSYRKITSRKWEKTRGHTI